MECFFISQIFALFPFLAIARGLIRFSNWFENTLGLYHSSKIRKKKELGKMAIERKWFTVIKFNFSAEEELMMKQFHGIRSKLLENCR